MLGFLTVGPGPGPEPVHLSEGRLIEVGKVNK